MRQTMQKVGIVESAGSGHNRDGCQRRGGIPTVLGLTIIGLSATALVGCGSSIQCQVGQAHTVADAKSLYEEGMVAKGLDVNSIGESHVEEYEDRKIVFGGQDTALQCLAHHFALWHTGRADVAAFLIEKGATIDLRNERGQTALMMAAFDNPEVLQVLLDHGANVNAVDAAGHTAVDYASWTAKNSFGGTATKGTQAGTILRAHGGVAGAEIHAASFGEVAGQIMTGVAAGANAAAGHKVVIAVPVAGASAAAPTSAPATSPACPCSGANPVFSNGQCYPNSNAACGATVGCQWQLCK